MSTRTQKKPDLAVESVSRQPQQGRSKASLERMLAAARELMVERGNEDFTLQDVSKRGNVSIGSIYLRFESKDNLVRAVIATTLESLGNKEDEMLAAVHAQSPTLGDFVPLYVERYAEILRENAPLLRLSMARAEFDPLVSEPGKKTAMRAQESSANTMLAYRDEFGGDDIGIKANAAFQVIFSALARQLSLGSTGESAHLFDWKLYKCELGKMALAYLRSGD